MLLTNLDLAFRAASVTLLLLLAVSLLTDFRNVLAARLGVAFALGTAVHAASYSLDVTSRVPLWHAPLIALSTGDIVVFWLFTRALFDDEFRLRWRHGLIWALVTAYSFAGCVWIAPSGHVRFSVTLVNLIVLGFIALAVWQMIASWPADLVERRRRVRVFIVCAIALYGGLNAILQIAVAGYHVGNVAETVNAGALTCTVAAIVYAMMRVEGADLFPAAVEPAPPLVFSQPAGDDVPDQKLIDALMRLMGDERIYRQENITIGVLATRLKIPEYRLRRLINQRLGYRNFNVFLNNHRIEEAKAALADPAQAEVPVITIAMDAGFQSLGPFNRAFKAVTGVTPTEYRRLKVDAV
ncbi:helix-turn-helix domain-containing protein [Bradyrhizobium sp. BR13661]|jgi:AraC-like DNA-binding protein|uniref:AraC family transcriptional regulator n=1 Tax=Bradyrhizobium sp. BR13661 TaxID=2940622 RepID=UPI0024756A82|nr:helix-turn-helix domain-containing protein [Bradyrhizobium sp. BR13661]MDH6261297.1 AraC-like DNA-binding protein [Bradyrhizobium sp. BR13661]